MRVFVTGASGHIGSAVVPELLAAGHQVIGLARSDISAAALKKIGAQVQRGDLDDLDGLRAAAAAADGVIHLGYKHDLALSGSAEGYALATAADLRVIQAFGEALAGSGKPLVGTGASLALAFAGLDRAGREDDVLPGGPRIDAENAVIALAQRGVRSSVIRLAPTVHSDLDRHGFVPSLIAMARQAGSAVYVGDGHNRWPALHARDAARLYRLAFEKAPAGTRLHGTAEAGIPFRDIASAIGRGLGLPARSISADDAPAQLGFLARFAQLDNPVSNGSTRALLDWTPTHAGLIADMEEGHYFARSKS